MDEAEFLERAGFEALHQLIPAPLSQRLGVRALSTGSAFVSAIGGLPASAVVVNRTIGLGLGIPATEEDVRKIVAVYTQAGIARYFIHRHRDSSPAALPDWLRAAGLEKARGWQKFERGPQPPPRADTDLELRRVGREHGEYFARIVCHAFDLGEAAVPWLAEVPGGSNFHIFMSFAGDVPAGTGGMYVRDGLAWFDYGATAPAFRRRGSQGALLALRVRHALELGCRRMLTCTGEAVPGDPQHSYRNILKAGFRETSVRENYAPPRR